MPEAPHDDLDLSEEDDRAIYRQRVDREFAHMTMDALRETAADLTGKPISRFPIRFSAVRAIADTRIREILAAEAQVAIEQTSLRR